MTCPWLAVLPTFSGCKTNFRVSFFVTLALITLPCPCRSPRLHFRGLYAGDVIPRKTDTRMGSRFVSTRPCHVLRRARVCFDVFLVSFRGANLSSFPRFIHVFRRFVVFSSFGGTCETRGFFARLSRVSKSLLKHHVRKTFFYVLLFFFPFVIPCFFPLHVDLLDWRLRSCFSGFFRVVFVRFVS